MRKIAVILVMMMLGVAGWCQAPQQFRYQTVVRNMHGELVKEEVVDGVVKICRGAESGEVVYEREIGVKTNSRGLLVLTLGDDGMLDGLDFSDNAYFLVVELWPEKDHGAYVLRTAQRLVSVPYAMYASLADSIDMGPYVEYQELSMHEDTIFLTGGSYVVLPEYFDGDYNKLLNKPTKVSDFVEDVEYVTEELQVLRWGHDTLYLTGGSFVVMNLTFDGDYNSLSNRPTIPSRVSQLENDLGYLSGESQVLSISNDTISLTGGSYVKLPFQPELQSLSDVVDKGNSMGNVQMKGVKDPTELQDALTLGYFDSVKTVWVNKDEDMGVYRTYVVDTCDGYWWHGEYYTEDGTYTYNYPTTGGYFSVDTLKLSLRIGSYNPEYARAKGSYMWHDSLLTTTGTHLYEYENEFRCPSVDTLFLTIEGNDGATCTAYRFESDTATVTRCGWLKWYGTTIRDSGVYEHSLGAVAANGCDSVVKIRVNIKPMFVSDTAIRRPTAVTWRGTTYAVSGDYSETLRGGNGCDSVYNLHLTIGDDEGVGAGSGLFSVSGSKQVRFAYGNLQYQAAGDYWRFAEHQYDMLGVTCASKDYAGWADLFGWATSGYHDAGDGLCVNYEPWASANSSAAEGTPEYTNNQYGYGPSRTMTDTNLTGTSGNYDWGVENGIVNGGDVAGLWRTMSMAEWDYVLNQRANAASLRSLGCIKGVPYITGERMNVYGYILLADGWSCPTGLGFVANAASADMNSYTMDEWMILEASGAVFLPIGVGENAHNCYWTSTSGGSGSAYAMALSSRSSVVAPYNRSSKYSVRLVQESQSGASNCVCTYSDTTIIASGSSYSWNGNTLTESGDYIEVLANNAGCDSVASISLILEDSGELSGVFTVGDNKQVKFSKGNLQYKATADVWKFADKQYSYVGKANKFASERYDGWVDLFAWATSGYHNERDVQNVYYRPWDRAEKWEIGHGPSLQMIDRHLSGTSGEYDWGVHNAIANGGNVAGTWRSLSREEWDYLLYMRTNSYDLQGYATINNVEGFVLLPDNWTLPSGVTFMASYSPADNIYNDQQWGLMEAAGAVFFPFGGSQTDEDSDEVEGDGVSAGYWTISNGDDVTGYNSNRYSVEPHWMAYRLTVDNNGNCYVYYDWKYNRYNVRLVKDL